MLARLYKVLAADIRRRAPVLLPHVSTDQLLDELLRRKDITPSQRAAFASGEFDSVAAALPLSAMIQALVANAKLTKTEGVVLLSGMPLAEFFACECPNSSQAPSYDGHAYEQASAAIRYGDLAEALVQVGRILPGLDRLPDLYTRRKGA